MSRVGKDLEIAIWDGDLKKNLTEKSYFNFIKGFLKLWRENDNEVGLFCPNCLFFYQLSAGRLRPMIDLWPFYSPKCKAIMQNAPPFMSHGNRNLHLGWLTWDVQKKWAKIHFFIPMAWTEPKGMKNCFFSFKKQEDFGTPWTQINFYIFSPLQMSSYKQGIGITGK